MAEYGKPPPGATPMRVDNSIAALQAKDGVGAKGARHYMRRIAFIQFNEQHKLFVTSHISDKDMPADFLGKWVPIDKYRKSRAFSLNISAQVSVDHPTECIIGAAPL